eukprot:sb/3463565/
MAVELLQVVLVSIYNILGLLAAFLGNLVVLIISAKYRAIEFDRISILLLQNLAAADFLIALTGWLPVAITTIIGEWVLGDVICYISGILVYIPSLSELLILTMIALHKVYTVAYPLRSRRQPVSRLAVIITVIIIWVLSTAVVVLSILKLGEYPVYESTTFACRSDHPEHKHDIAIKGVFLMVSVPALLAIIVSNFALLAIVARHNSKKMKHTQARGSAGDTYIVSKEWCSVDNANGKNSRNSSKRSGHSVLSGARSSDQLASKGKGISPPRDEFPMREIVQRRQPIIPRYSIRRRLSAEDFYPLRKSPSSPILNMISPSLTRAMYKVNSSSSDSLDHTSLITSDDEESEGQEEEEEESEGEDGLGPSELGDLPPPRKSSLKKTPNKKLSQFLGNPSSNSLGAGLSMASRELSRSREIIVNIGKKIVSQTSQSFNVTRKTVFMVSSVSFIFILSITPQIVDNVLKTLHHDNILPSWFLWFQSEIYFLNVACNPIIYTFHSNRFRTFLKNVLTLRLNYLRRISVNVLEFDYSMIASYAGAGQTENKDGKSEGEERRG